MAIDREATLKTAEKHLRTGRLDAAIVEYARVVEDRPSDWTSLTTLGDLYIRTAQPERAVPLYMRVAEHLLAEGFHAKAAAHFKKVLKIVPGEERAQLRLAEIAAAHGLLAEARAYYGTLERRRRQAGDEAGADEILVASGELDPDDLGARLAAAQAMERIGRDADAIARYHALCDEFVKRDRTMEAAALLCLDRAVEGHAARGEFPEAAYLLRSFAGQGPPRVDLLLRLVELCVDGGLDADTVEAQAMLADAYLATGRPGEARVIAEDLFARDPENDVHAARLREALRMLDVPDAGAVMAALTAGRRIDDTPEPSPVSDDDRAPNDSIEAVGGPVVEEGLLPDASDGSLEGVFQELRSRADAAGDDGAEHLDLARTYLELDMRDEAIDALELAARSPRYRFEASSLLAQCHRDNSDLPAAIDWFERAAEAPAPSPDAARALLYDLGDVLETMGEQARALAVFIELRADAPEYRDVSSRVERLAQTETEG